MASTLLQILAKAKKASEPTPDPKTFVPLIEEMLKLENQAVALAQGAGRRSSAAAQRRLRQLYDQIYSLPRQIKDEAFRLYDQADRAAWEAGESEYSRRKSARQQALPIAPQRSQQRGAVDAVIHHSPEHGTLVYGDTRPHREALKAAGLRWSPRIAWPSGGGSGAWYVPKSRDTKRAPFAFLDQLVGALQDGGSVVALQIGQPGAPPRSSAGSAPARQRRSSAPKPAPQKRQVRNKYGIKVGDIYVSSWGYEQTNVDFYEVVAVGPAMVTIRRINSKLDPESARGDRVLPVPGSFRGQPMKKRPSKDKSIKIESYSWARPWNGKSQYATPSGWGH